jgi:hypothetical protein
MKVKELIEKLGKMSADELTKFQKKYRNIRSLIDYGYIPEEKAK